MGGAAENPLAILSEALSTYATTAQRLVVAIHTKNAPFRSGSLWRPDVAVASNQVIPKADEFEVIAADGSRIPARVAGRDPSTNIVALRLGSPIEAAIPQAADPRFGALVLVLAAGRDGPEVRLGITRTVGSAWYSQAGGRIDQRITLDLRLSGREEGGPVVDAAGGIIGMSTGGPRGRALVIPAATIERVLEPLLATGRIERGWLGAAFYPVSLPGSPSRQTGHDRGLMVLRVVENGPAAVAGVAPGDIIIAVGSATAAQPRQIAQSLGPESVGQKVDLHLIRGGVPMNLTVTITGRPAE